MVPLCQFFVGLCRGRFFAGLAWWLELAQGRRGFCKKCGLRRGGRGSLPDTLAIALHGALSAALAAAVRSGMDAGLG